MSYLKHSKSAWSNHKYIDKIPNAKGGFDYVYEYGVGNTSPSKSSDSSNNNSNNDYYSEFTRGGKAQSALNSAYNTAKNLVSKAKNQQKNYYQNSGQAQGAINNYIKDKLSPVTNAYNEYQAINNQGYTTKTQTRTGKYGDEEYTYTYTTVEALPGIRGQGKSRLVEAGKQYYDNINKLAEEKARAAAIARYDKKQNENWKNQYGANRTPLLKDYLDTQKAIDNQTKNIRSKYGKDADYNFRTGQWTANTKNLLSSNNSNIYGGRSLREKGLLEQYGEKANNFLKTNKYTADAYNKLNNKYNISGKVKNVLQNTLTTDNAQKAKRKAYNATKSTYSNVKSKAKDIINNARNSSAYQNAKAKASNIATSAYNNAKSKASSLYDELKKKYKKG